MTATQLILPVGGVVLILAVVYLTGGLKTATLATAEAVRHRLGRDAPELVRADLLIDAGGRAALAYDTASRAGALLYVMGDRVNCERLAANIVKAVKIAKSGDATILELRLRNFTRGRVRLRLGPAARDEAGRWRDRLAAFGPGAP